MTQSDGIYPSMMGARRENGEQATASLESLCETFEALSMNTDYKESDKPKYIFGILPREYYTRRQWFLIKTGYFHRRGCGPLWEFLPNGKLKFVGNQGLM